jgi:hypothetical protein
MEWAAAMVAAVSMTSCSDTTGPEIPPEELRAAELVGDMIAQWDRGSGLAPYLLNVHHAASVSGFPFLVETFLEFGADELGPGTPTPEEFLRDNEGREEHSAAFLELTGRMPIDPGPARTDSVAGEAGPIATVSTPVCSADGRTCWIFARRDTRYLVYSVGIYRLEWSAERGRWVVAGSVGAVT